MLDRAALQAGFRSLGVPDDRPVIVHASLSAFGFVEGSAPQMVEALLSAWQTVVMPTFTYKTMLVPEVGPPANGLQYGTCGHNNRMAQFFRRDLPADRLMGAVAEALRRHPLAERSLHPILSFSGVNATPELRAQSLAEPLAPLRLLHQAGGWVLLLGVDHTVNTSIHYAEKLAGRPGFLRWALTPRGVVACPQFPGCSDGFEALVPHLARATRLAQIGQAWVRAVPLDAITKAVGELLRLNPRALLCDHSYCDRCEAQRQRLIKPLGGLSIEHLSI